MNNDEQIEKEEQHKMALVQAKLKPYLNQIYKDIDSGSANIGADLSSLEKVVSNEDPSLASFVFQKVRKYAVTKYSNPSLMPQSIIDGIDSMLLWQMVAVPKMVYDKKLPEKYVDSCSRLLPKYNHFFHGLEFNTTFHNLGVNAKYDNKLKQIKRFIDTINKNYTQLLYSLNVNMQHASK